MHDVELVGSLCAQLCSVSDSTARPYALQFPTTTPRPTALQSGQLHYNQVGRTIIWLVVLQSGQSRYNWVTSRRVASHRIRLGGIASGRVASHQVGSVALQSGRSRYNRVGRATIGSVTLLSGLAGALSLHVLFHSFACSSPPLPAKV